MKKSKMNGLVSQVPNLLLGLFGLFLLGRGFFVSDGLAGLGLVLLMTAVLCFLAFQISVEQLRQEASPFDARNHGERLEKRLDIAS